MCDNNRLHNAKEEILTQITKLNIVINAKGFFEVDRQFMAAVGSKFK